MFSRTRQPALLPAWHRRAGVWPGGALDGGSCPTATFAPCTSRDIDPPDPGAWTPCPSAFPPPPPPAGPLPTQKARQCLLLAHTDRGCRRESPCPWQHSLGGGWASETPDPDLGPGEAVGRPLSRPPPHSMAGSHARPAACPIMSAHSRAPAIPAPRLGVTHGAGTPLPAPTAGGRPEHTHLSRLDAGRQQDGPGNQGWGRPGPSLWRIPQEGPGRSPSGGWPRNCSPCRAGPQRPQGPRGRVWGKGLGAETGPTPPSQPRSQHADQPGRVPSPPGPARDGCPSAHEAGFTLEDRVGQGPRALVGATWGSPPQGEARPEPCFYSSQAQGLSHQSGCPVTSRNEGDHKWLTVRRPRSCQPSGAHTSKGHHSSKGQSRPLTQKGHRPTHPQGGALLTLPHGPLHGQGARRPLPRIPQEPHLEAACALFSPQACASLPQQWEAGPSPLPSGPHRKWVGDPPGQEPHLVQASGRRA